MLKLWLPPALTERRVRLYVVGHFISVAGTWFQLIALSWLVYRLTKSTVMLGLTGFLLQLPYLVFGPLAGLAVDRLPRVKLLIAIDIVLAILALVLAGLAFAGVSNVWAYLSIASLIGIANAFETPARQSLFTVMVADRSHLPSMIGISSGTFNLARLLGPALAGFALLYVPESVCFLINAASFAAIIVSIIRMRLPADWREKGASAAPRQSFVESFRDLSKLPAVRYLLPTLAAIGLLGTAHIHLMPSIAETLFGGGSGAGGILMAATGVGALLTSVTLAMQRGGRLLLHLVRIAPVMLGLGLILLANTRSFAVGICAMMLVGCALMAAAAATNTLVQQSVPEGMRGRAISLYLMAYNGMGPFGHLMSGLSAAKLGLPFALTLNGVLIVGAAIFGLIRLARHPEARADIERAAGLR